MTSSALTGFTFGVTADRRWEEQAQLLERRGARVVHGACIRTLPLGPEDGLARATDELVARPPDIVVLTTGIGTRGWFAAAESLGTLDLLTDALEGAMVLARGPKAAGAALTAGLEVHWRAADATGEELVAYLAELAADGPFAGGRPVTGPTRRVAIQLDGSPAGGLGDAVRALGYEVVEVPVYRWSLPDDTGPAERLADLCADGALDAVTFTAAYTVANFFELAHDRGRTQDVLDAFRGGRTAAVCVGPVCARRARAEGIDPDALVVPNQPRLGAMVRAATSAFELRRRLVRLATGEVALQGRMVQVGDAGPVTLTDRERGVLDLLARRPGVVIAKDTLLREVWGDGALDAHVVEVTVNRLRRRLGDAGDSIETVVRRGYRLAVE